MLRRVGGWEAKSSFYMAKSSFYNSVLCSGHLSVAKSDACVVKQSTGFDTNVTCNHRVQRGRRGQAAGVRGVVLCC
eukprot:52721-Eustigmatos_ZCMA.PRE.1